MIVNKELKKKYNIAIIGMPGSGKTTIGKKVSEISGKKFVDIDELIEKENNITVPQIFEKYGEKEFRRLETDMIYRISKEEDIVISTGGGCVLDSRNYESLKQNAIIFYIKRDLEKLDISNRPLSKGGMSALINLFNIRKPLYENYSNYELQNIQIDTCANEIYDKFLNSNIIL